ncbi:hypothetical protein [Kordiimonas aquimaris]|uniref:hypothetical protein n=1 Tax=Kordiimonas aquimaris TaxID=707591 RepID=UPI0021D3CACC|nr:hypothetical protein [Kordiimonas aquimaris]
MKQSSDDIYQRFFMHLRYWTWVHVLYRYDETHLLIIDEPMADYLNGARKEKLRSQIASPDNYADAITPEIKKVMVLCEQGELAIIRAIQSAHPDLHVTSGTYGYMRSGRDRYPRLVKYDPKPALPAAQPIVFLSTPYADAEFVTSVMAENGMAYAHEFLARPYASWLQLHRHFQVSRFYSGVEKKYAKGGKLSYLLQTDVLESVFENTAFSQKQFLRYLKRMNAKVVLIERRDTLTQATMMQLLDKTSERSVWTKKPSKKLHTPIKAGACLESFEQISEINQGAALLNDVRGCGVDTVDVYLEDFIHNQQADIARIAQCTGIELPSDFKTIEYKDGYGEAAGLHVGADKVRRELLDRLGLHV